MTVWDYQYQEIARGILCLQLIILINFANMKLRSHSELISATGRITALLMTVTNERGIRLIMFSLIAWMLYQYYVTLMAQYLEKCLINNVKFNSVLACTSYSSVWDCIGRLLLRWQNRAGTELAEVSRDTWFYSVWLGELWEFLSFLDFRGWAVVTLIVQSCKSWIS